MRRRKAEERGDPVSHVRVDDAAVLLDDTAHPADAVSDQRLDLLGRQALSDRRGADDVGEERRDGAQLIFLGLAQQVGGDRDGRTEGG